MLDFGMDHSWWEKLSSKVAVLVPTRSLESKLQSRFVADQATAGKVVWESPNILTWNDLLNKLWAANQLQILETGTLLNETQSLLLWHRVIERSKFQDNDLALLNVQQTAKAAQKSWGLMHDWKLPPITHDQHPNADTEQFWKWASAYHALLLERGMIDSQLLIEKLTDLAKQGRLRCPFDALHWHAFDLLNTAQVDFIEASNAHINHRLEKTEPREPEIRHFKTYDHGNDELAAVFSAARSRIENNPELTISIVVPDLQRRITQVQTIAAHVFYPTEPPLELANNNLVYRFSLGQPIISWSAIEAALNVIKLLRGRVSLNDLRRLLRCRFLQSFQEAQPASTSLETALEKIRLNSITLKQLPTMVDTLLKDETSSRKESLIGRLGEVDTFIDAVRDELTSAATDGQYRTLTFRRWREIFTELLELFGWSTATENEPLSSLQFQLKKSWQTLLADFELLGQAQSKVGLSRALEILQQLCRDRVFLPEAAHSPIFISGVFEALGSEVDLCFITGMHDGYPAPMKNDPFIGQLLKKSAYYPSATTSAHYQQAKAVLRNLQGIGKECQLSFARFDDQDSGVEQGVSALLRQHSFTKQVPAEEVLSQAPTLEIFTDTSGPPVSSAVQIRGGTRVFTDQSNCAFRAFAMHRLSCAEQREAEFGLDQLDRGNVVHLLLEKAWRELQTKSELEQVRDQGQLASVVQRITQETIKAAATDMPADKRALLELEAARLHHLLHNWLTLELTRPQGFSVSELEQEYQSEVAGLQLRFKLDRLDVSDDGRAVVIDYKTGQANRKDWQGDRLRQPQLPLYAVALSKLKRNPPAGIAYAQLQKKQSQFIDLSEAGIFCRENAWTEKRHQEWLAVTESWPNYFEKLGEEFLSGNAEVNPIEEATCKYCDLKPLCRISQLRRGWEADDDE
jgi:probable DNA repair protein